jgi:hypothetical protein
MFLIVYLLSSNFTQNIHQSIEIKRLKLKKPIQKPHVIN